MFLRDEKKEEEYILFFLWIQEVERGFGAVPDARRACGQIRSILPDACIALLFKKKQKYALVIKKGQKYGNIIAR